MDKLCNRYKFTVIKWLLGKIRIGTTDSSAGSFGTVQTLTMYILGLFRSIIVMSLFIGFCFQFFLLPPDSYTHILSLDWFLTLLLGKYKSFVCQKQSNTIDIEPPPLLLFVMNIELDFSRKHSKVTAEQSTIECIWRDSSRLINTTNSFLLYLSAGYGRLISSVPFLSSRISMPAREAKTWEDYLFKHSVEELSRFTMMVYLIW